MEEKSRQINGLMRVMEATEELFSENRHLEDELERRQEEIDDLNEQLEQQEQEIADLRQQLLETENQHLEAEVHAKPLEIHNHFESGSNSQVFNDKVNGKFIRKQNDKKKNKKRWKKIVRKM